MFFYWKALLATSTTSTKTYMYNSFKILFKALALDTPSHLELLTLTSTFLKDIAAWVTLEK